MKIVIDIPEQAYEVIKRNSVVAHAHNLALLTKWITNGTPLPKGHGDLIDRKDLMDRCVTYLESSGATTNLIKSALTIIEADKEGAEE